MGLRYIFIEDLDRINNVKIFSHLRNLNFMLNNSNEINDRVVFIYAIRDSLFQGNERTKFFDFIIPVIPTVGKANSAGFLADKVDEFKKEGINCGIDSDYIYDIAPFIAEMRVIQNIFNEYALYYEMIIKKNLGTLDMKKLFSLIVLKNVDSIEFANLETNNSLVDKTFDGKREYIIKNITDARESDLDIEEVEEEIKKIRNTSTNDYIKNDDEINKLFENHDLLRVLLSRDYIGEDYYLYLTMFKGDKLSASDMEFIQAVKLNKNPDYIYKLDDVKEVVKWLNDADYENIAALNIDLLDFLLENKEENKYQMIINQILGNKEGTENFINTYLEIGKAKLI